MLGSAPATSSTWTQAAWPAAQASCRAVRPPGALSGLARRLSSSCRTSVWPRLAATCSGVVSSSSYVRDQSPRERRDVGLRPWREAKSGQATEEVGRGWGKGAQSSVPSLPCPAQTPRVPLARTQSADVEAEIPPSLWVAGIKDGIRSQASAGVGEDAGDRAHVPSQHCLPVGQGRSGGRPGDDGSRARLRVFCRPSVGLLHQPGTEGMSVTGGFSLPPALFWGPAHEDRVRARGKRSGGRRGRGQRQTEGEEEGNTDRWRERVSMSPS